ncbi:DUF3035 domain-containing protein [Sphingomonas sp. ASV193]|uniref:DUF3035 domain-containing protein n=1 Tax=Sphingomonas sp. ASV193 TaxID=3144405 RepID=UPI0032E8D652
MRKALFLALAASSVLTLGACAHRSAPLDEFSVARNAPLVIPPDFSLTPPTVGTTTLSAEQAQQQAIDALFGGPSPRSEIERTILEKAGRDRTIEGARSTAGDEQTRVVDKGAYTLTVLAAQQGNTSIASAQ